MPAKKNANGDGTVYQRIDGRWCGSGYVQAADGTRKRIYVYGNSHREASDKSSTPNSPTRPGAPPCSPPTRT